MPTYKLEGYVSYTSYPNLSAETASAIAASQQPLPQWIVMPDGTKINWRQELQWAEKRTRAGYAVLENGIRIKYESNASPDYYKPNGHGSCSQHLTVRSEVPLEFEHENP